jgi:hypothetical protein
MIALLLIAASLAGSLVGEVIRWDIQFAGVSGGQAWCSVLPGEDGAVLLEAGARSADWYARLYPIDDFVRSTWAPGEGSRRYETRFREGRFIQDQDMRLSAEEVTVAGRQKVEEGWREWESRYPGTAGVEDPVSAIYAMRLLAGPGPWTYPVFSGKETWPLQIELVGEERIEDTPLGAVDVQILSLRTLHKGDWEQRGRFLMYVTDDDRRIPVRFVVKTSIGAIKANMIEYRPPD